MGKYARKTAHKKFQKEEKAKIKLKVSHKTELPKGQNITNTSFKVKKIVINEQLKIKSNNEVVSRSSYDIKDLLGKLQYHHNVMIRKSAVNTLINMIHNGDRSIVLANFVDFLEAAMKLILDEDKSIRDSNNKLLPLILSKMTEDEMKPLFHIITKYLTCAMSHINENIRENSLNVLDTLIKDYVNLVAMECEEFILPAFLNLISCKVNDTDRRLMLQYSKKTTTTVWRIMVLKRLHSLMEAIIHSRSSAEPSVKLESYVGNTDDSVIYVKLPKREFESILSLTEPNSDIQTSHIQLYLEKLVPLLMQIFMEVAPRCKHEADKSYSDDAILLIRHISGILLLSWKMMEISNVPNANVKKWFVESFASLILVNMFIGRFPYIGRSKKEMNMKKRKMNNQLPDNLYDKPVDEACVAENITLCHLYLLFYKENAIKSPLRYIHSYLLENLNSCGKLPLSTVKKLLQCVDVIFSMDNKICKENYLTGVIKRTYDECRENRRTFIADAMFEYLYKLAINTRFIKCLGGKKLNSWLRELPKLLCDSSVSYRSIVIISDIARRNFRAFRESLDAYIENILDNLPSIEITDADKTDEAKKIIVELLYHVTTFDQDLVANLTKAVNEKYFNNLSDYVAEIIDFRTKSIIPVTLSFEQFDGIEGVFTSLYRKETERLLSSL